MRGRTLDAHENWSGRLKGLMLYCPYCIVGMYLSRGNIFVVFVVDRQTTKLPRNSYLRKSYHIHVHSVMVYRNHENISTCWPKFTAHKNIFSPKSIYTLYGISRDSNFVNLKSEILCKMKS